MNLILALYAGFLTIYFFTTLLSFIKSTEVVCYIPIFNLSTLLVELLKLFDTFFNLPIYNLSTLDFKSAKSIFLANVNVSTRVAFFKSAFVTKLDKPNSTLTLHPEYFGSEKYSLIDTMSFLSNPIVAFSFKI